MIDYKIVYNFINENCENVSVLRKGSEFHARCPICGDSKKSLKKKRFHLDYNSGSPMFHCFNCGSSGSFIKLVSILKNQTPEEVKRNLFRFKRSDIQQRISPPKTKSKEVTKTTHFNFILKDCISLNDKPTGIIDSIAQKKLRKFIKDRNIPKDTKLYISYNGKYQGRIIIPIFDDNKNIIYFQARATIKNTPNKYLNPSFPKQSFIFNVDKFNKDKYIIVTEGIIDCFNIGPQGTTCFGKEISEDFIEKLLKHTDVGVIIALDNDDEGRKSLFGLLKKQISQKRKVKFFLFPKEYDYIDINSYVSEEKIDNVYDFVVKNSYRNYQVMPRLAFKKKSGGRIK